MPGSEYNTGGPSGLRKLLGSSGFRYIGVGINALGADIERQILGFLGKAEAVTPEPGTLLKMTATATVTLPAASKNAVIGVSCASGETTIKTPSGVKIYGDFTAGAETIKLVLNQHIVLQSDGTNWFIISGEPKREQAYSALVEHTGTSPILYSAIINASRPSLVSGWIKSVSATLNQASVEIGPSGFLKEVLAVTTTSTNFYPLAQLWVPAGSYYTVLTGAEAVVGLSILTM